MQAAHRKSNVILLYVSCVYTSVCRDLLYKMQMWFTQNSRFQSRQIYEKRNTKDKLKEKLVALSCYGDYFGRILLAWIGSTCSLRGKGHYK